MMHSCPVVTLTALALLASVADAQDRARGGGRDGGSCGGGRADHVGHENGLLGWRPM